VSTATSVNPGFLAQHAQCKARVSARSDSSQKPLCWLCGNSPSRLLPRRIATPLGAALPRAAMPAAMFGGHLLFEVMAHLLAPADLAPNRRAREPSPPEIHGSLLRFNRLSKLKHCA